MVEFTGGEKLQRKLAEIASKIKGGTLRVGFLEDTTYPDGTSVPLVAIINEYGAPSRGQPPRPFFRNAIARGKTHWGQDLADLLQKNDFEAGPALKAMGEQIEGEIKQSINDFTSPGLKPSTIARKGFSKPLIETSHMVNSVDYEITE